MLVLGAPASAGIVVSVATDRPSYYPGQSLGIDITASKTAAQDVTLQFPSPIQSQYTIDGALTIPDTGLTVLTHRQIPAGGLVSWSYQFPWRTMQTLTSGSHSLTGTVVGYGVGGPVVFQVVQPALPTHDFVIDFDRLPDGSKPLSVSEYWPYGVHFHSITDASGRGVADAAPSIAT